MVYQCARVIDFKRTKNYELNPSIWEIPYIVQRTGSSIWYTANLRNFDYQETTLSIKKGLVVAKDITKKMIF